MNISLMRERDRAIKVREHSKILNTLRERVIANRYRASKFKTASLKRDIYTLSDTIDDLITQLSREYVECRRCNIKGNHKITKIMNDINVLFNKVEKNMSLFMIEER